MHQGAAPTQTIKPQEEEAVFARKDCESSQRMRRTFLSNKIKEDEVVQKVVLVKVEGDPLNTQREEEEEEEGAERMEREREKERERCI